MCQKVPIGILTKSFRSPSQTEAKCKKGGEGGGVKEADCLPP